MTAPVVDFPVTGEVLAAGALVAGGCPACFLPLAEHPVPGTTPCPIETSTDPVHVLALSAAHAADRDVLDDLVDAHTRPPQPSSNPGPRVSDYGRCPRVVWYRERPPADYIPVAVERRRAVLGILMHEAAQVARQPRYPWRYYEMSVPVPGLAKLGRLDEYDPVTGIITDHKTAGEYMWGVYGDGPQDAAWGQVLIYAYALEALGYPVRLVRIIAIHRDTGEEEHFDREYDPVAALAALDQLTTLATQLELGQVPDRAGYGPRSFPCSYCPARDHCWNVPAAQAAGRSPVSYTILGPDPDEEIIGWAARELHAANTAKGAATRAKEYAEQLLEGVKPGKYAGMVVKVRTRRMPVYKRAFDRVLGLWSLPDDLRPPVEDVEVPDQTDQRWIEATPVRVATQKARSRRAPRGKKTTTDA